MWKTWVGSDPASYTYDTCFSLWYHPRDHAQSIISMSSSSLYSSDRVPSKVVNGFFCRSTDHFCFSSTTVANSWWRADLGKPHQVSEILIQLRYGESNFLDVFVSLGNSSDYNNPILATSPGEGPSGGLVNFTATIPVTGRYLHVQAAKKLSICNLQIIG